MESFGIFDTELRLKRLLSEPMSEDETRSISQALAHAPATAVAKLFKMITRDLSLHHSDSSSVEWANIYAEPLASSLTSETALAAINGVLAALLPSSKSLQAVYLGHADHCPYQAAASVLVKALLPPAGPALRHPRMAVRVFDTVLGTYVTYSPFLLMLRVNMVDLAVSTLSGRHQGRRARPCLAEVLVAGDTGHVTALQAAAAAGGHPELVSWLLGSGSEGGACVPALKGASAGLVGDCIGGLSAADLCALNGDVDNALLCREACGKVNPARDIVLAQCLLVGARRCTETSRESILHAVNTLLHAIPSSTSPEVLASVAVEATHSADLPSLRLALRGTPDLSTPVRGLAAQRGVADARCLLAVAAGDNNVGALELMLQVSEGTVEGGRGAAAAAAAEHGAAEAAEWLAKQGLTGKERLEAIIECPNVSFECAKVILGDTIIDTTSKLTTALANVGNLPVLELACSLGNALPSSVGRGAAWPEVLKFLLAHGVAVDAADQPSALAAAAAGGAVESVQTLLSAGASVDKVDPMTGLTSLAAASASNCIQAVSNLLKAGANVNAKCEDGQTALAAAAEAGAVECVQALLAAGAEVEAKDSAGNTSMHAAARSGSDEVVRALLGAGAGAGVANTLGVTPLMVAAEAGATAVMPLLIANGASVSVMDSRGRTALHYAAKGVVSQKTMLLLVVNGANVNARDVNLDTPLLLAVQHPIFGQGVRAVALLLALGADSSLANAAGTLAVDVASARGTMMKRLLEGKKEEQITQKLSLNLSQLFRGSNSPTLQA